jgi:putative inorganic carbon (HCO3(-)) transporter
MASARNVSPVSWALGLTVAAAPLYVVRWRIGPVPTTLLELLIVATIALYVIAMLSGTAPRLSRTPLDVPIVLLLFAGAVGIFVAPDHRGALGIFRAYMLEPVLVYYIAVAVLAPREAVEKVLAAWAAGAIAFSVFDLFIFGHAVATHTLVPGHAQAAFNIDPNSVALYLEPLIGLSAGFALLGSGLHRRVAIVAWAVMLAAELATLSRGGLLALAALAVIAAVTLPTARVRMGILAGAVAAALALLLAPVTGPRLLHILDPRVGTFTIRGQIWAATARMLRDHPLFGAGINAYQSTMVPYRAGDPYLVPEPYPHNIFLSSWTELGLLGLAAFAWILVALIVMPWGAYRRAQPAGRALYWGLGAAFTMLLVHGLVDTPYWKNDLSLEFWVLAAITIISVRSVHKTSQP